MTKPQLQRIAIILGFMVLVVGVLFAVYFLFFAPFVNVIVRPTNTNTSMTNGSLPNINTNRPKNTNAGPIANGTGSLPQPSEIANGGLTFASNLTTKSVADPAMSQDGKSIQYYSDVDGRFVRIDPLTGKITDLASQKFPDVQNVTWAPDGQRAVLEFPDDRKIIYDFQTKRQFTLPNEATKFSFSTDSAKLAFEFVGSGQDNSYLLTANSDGTSSKAIAKLGDQASNVEVAWSPTNEVVGLFKKSANGSQQEIVFLGQNDENFKTMTTDGSGFKGKWTPDGNKLLYTTYSEATNWNPELHLVFARGETIGQGDVDLGIQTSLDKCTFNHAGTYAYCAVPDLLERGSGLYPEFSSNVRDTIYTINLTNGNVVPLAQPVSDGLDRFTVKTLLLTPDEGTLYFTDLATGRLMKIRLK